MRTPLDPAATSDNVALMSANFLESLPLAQRLALSYAPVAAREATLTLLLLDNRLAAILRQRGDEVIIAQMKLAWWRDRLSSDPEQWPKGEPLLARLRVWPGDPAQLEALVNGWEGLLAEELTSTDWNEFAAGRAAAWGALAGALGIGQPNAAVEQTARAWALADLALHTGDQAERQALQEQVLASSDRSARLPRSLRSLAVLHGLSARALQRGSDDLLDGPGAMLVAMRLGITGR